MVYRPGASMPFHVLALADLPDFCAAEGIANVICLDTSRLGLPSAHALSAQLEPGCRIHLTELLAEFGAPAYVMPADRTFGRLTGSHVELTLPVMSAVDFLAGAHQLHVAQVSNRSRPESASKIGQNQQQNQSASTPNRI